MNELAYAEEEMKHFSDLLEGYNLDEDEKHKLLRIIRVELIGAWRTGYHKGQDNIKQRVASFKNVDIEFND